MSVENDIEKDIDNFIDSADFSAIKIWAKTYDIPCDSENWLDDDWPDKEDALRVVVKDCMRKAIEDNMGKQK